MSGQPELPAASWSGDEHLVKVAAAGEAGLSASDAEVESFTAGFASGMTLEDGEGAIVLSGRTVLKAEQLERSIRPILRYAGVASTAAKVRVFDGRFEIKISRAAADQSTPSLDAAKTTLQLWLSFGMLGMGAWFFLPHWVSGLLWGTGLMLGGWQMRHGLASGRAMLGARLTMGLAMMAAEERLILPPAGPEDALPDPARPA